jgi:hypothetical protein
MGAAPKASIRWGLAWVLAAWCGSGCGSPPGLSGLQVRSASITGVEWAGIDLVVGWGWANGVLDVVDTSGQTHSFDVQLSGPSAGVVFDVAGADLASTTARLTLPEGKTLQGSDLLGSYLGTEEAIHVGFGGEQHDLTNGAGVKLDSGNFNLGVGVFVGFEWLAISAR